MVFEKINKADTPLARLTADGTGVKRVSSKREGVDITTDATDHKGLTKRVLNNQ